MSLDELQTRVRRFAEERDWMQFHTPKNLLLALTGEVGELTAIFQWLSDDNSLGLDHQKRAAVEEEVADVLIYLLRLCDVLDIDLGQATAHKIERNREKYPVELSRGRATKYDKLSAGGDVDGEPLS